MLTLAIETSGLSGSLALFEGDRFLEERTLQLGARHGQALIPGIRRLLSDHGRTPRDCGLVAVSIGPGSYTGLRVGVVCAKTLAYAANCPVAGVETLEAVACNSPDGVSRVAVICDAQRGDVYAGLFERDAMERWTRQGPIAIVSGRELIEGLKKGDTVSGPAADNWEEMVPEGCRILPEECRLPRAQWIGRLGIRQAGDGRLGDPYRLEPLYLRRSSAEDKWEALGRK